MGNNIVNITRLTRNNDAKSTCRFVSRLICSFVSNCIRSSSKIRTVDGLGEDRNGQAGIVSVCRRLPVNFNGRGVTFFLDLLVQWTVDNRRLGV